MKKYILLPLLALLLATTGLCASEETRRFAELDRCLTLRDHYLHQKEARIDSLRHLLYPSMEDEERFRICNALYQECYTYRFDSAMLYVDRGEEIALRLNNPRHLALTRIHRSILLSTSGYFSESIRNLESIEHRTLEGDRELQTEYYTACEWAYSMWAEYSGDNTYAPDYYRQEMNYQDSLIRVLPPDTPLHHYWQAERLYRQQRYAEAESFYLKALEGLPVNVRLYAMTTFGLALISQQMGRPEQYEHYLIRAAISDQICPLKENLALQELALYIYEHRKGEMARANRYLGYSMEDAQFYNNRLRMLQIAQKFPSIVLSYQQQNEAKSRRLQVSLLCISLLSLGVMLLLAYICRQMIQLRKRRRSLTEMNEQLQQLNRQLLDTNHTREEYVSLFMDLCAAYIDKLNRYQDLVKRKVKAKQTDDLLKLANATRLSEADAKEFFLSFDTAFLNLYPTFIQEFNGLLREEEAIVPKRGELLNTELRIFALVRMGVKDSTKIATLLFYSPQTIYNHRSAVKNKARVREEFERQVEHLCEVL